MKSRFDGDGRISVKPIKQDIRPGTMPKAVTRSAARRILKQFEESGQSFHSGQGAMLWIIREHCRKNKIPYDIYQEFGGGPIFVQRRQYLHEKAKS